MITAESLRSAFYPDIYDKEVNSGDPMKLCLTKREGLGRYALVLIDFDNDRAFESQLLLARQSIAKATKALWFFNEVGAYIVFKAREVPKAMIASDLAIDKTGLHAVIIQGVHLVGPDNYHLFNHSQWLNHTFEVLMKFHSRFNPLKPKGLSISFNRAYCDFLI